PHLAASLLGLFYRTTRNPGQWPIITRPHPPGLRTPLPDRRLAVAGEQVRPALLPGQRPPQRLGPRPVVPEVPVLQVHPHRGQRLRHEPHFHARRPPRVRLRLPFRRDAPPQHDPLRHAAREHPAPRSLHAGRVPLEPPPPGPRLEHHRRQPALGPGVLRRPP